MRALIIAIVVLSVILAYLSYNTPETLHQWISEVYMRGVTIFLVIITAIISDRSFKKHDIYERWIFNPYQVYTNKQYWRFFSSGFIHANYLHLVINVAALFYFGKTIEFISSIDNILGGKIFYIILYLGGIAVANIPGFLKYRYLPRYNSLGASGGVAAVLFGSILYRPIVPFFGIDFLPAFLLGIIYLVYSYFQGRKMEDNVNHDAHLYGAGFGIVFTIAINPEVAIGFYEQISQFSLF